MNKRETWVNASDELDCSIECEKKDFFWSSWRDACYCEHMDWTEKCQYFDSDDDSAKLWRAVPIDEDIDSFEEPGIVEARFDIGENKAMDFNYVGEGYCRDDVEIEDFGYTFNSWECIPECVRFGIYYSFWNGSSNSCYC